MDTKLRPLVVPTCPICDEEAQPNKFVVTLCGHVFHEPCILRWDATQINRGQHSRCPVCNELVQRVIPNVNQPLHLPRSFYVPLYSIEQLPPDPEPVRLTVLGQDEVGPNHILEENQKLQASLTQEKRLRVQQTTATEESIRILRAESDEAQKQYQQSKDGFAQAQRYIELQHAHLRSTRASLHTTTVEAEKLRQLKDQLKLALEDLNYKNKTLEEFNARSNEEETNRTDEI
ncbi:hypothetical protein CROQUDRAFT_670140 [Cronartium quercuum f. sp. fusiforme G11]|uniref:RING-type domain-containing protein n=1 Tax=Cronartium quercuum f. sp. fusiforme G11 TaxID=708437 RepID=A0A9P6TD20_9BASI|nr:hypothetical protein CROQUDRAFT_670140 [Cronartium quercuum f. sp. fusiforme G11]